MPVFASTYGTRGGRSKVLTAIVAICLALPVSAEPLRILALGDSLTAGYGLPEPEGFVPQMNAWLAAQGEDAVLVNAGVSGDTTAGALARLDWALDPEIDAMIVTLGGNDLLRGLDPADARANLDAILEGAGDLPVLLVGMQASGNYGAAYKAAFDGMYPDLAETHDALLAPSFFEGLAAEGDPGAVRGYLQADGIHPNAEGVTRIVAALGPRVQALIDRVE
ncbi:arylesterase [Mesobacterium pallidum]|uniref:arylesterase n=1 Tax=Mesobacterium pallidum TaxID=2872037 RepID=UPI001EE32D7B|nr:arylesterase [Mesobacterium pallidum]